MINELINKIFRRIDKLTFISNLTSKSSYASKKYKCNDCNNVFTSKKSLYNHVEKMHFDLIPENKTIAQYIFDNRHKGRDHKCVICKINECDWNEKTEKYQRLCSEKCREIYKKQFKEKMMNKYGKIHLLDDPKHQQKMLDNRKISKPYLFKDGGQIITNSSYEYDFIEYCVNNYNIKYENIMKPIDLDIIFKYTYEDDELTYIPDYYMQQFNLIIEIKDGGDNPNNHHKIQAVDKIKELLKDEAVISSGKYNYIKITNKEYINFDKIMEELKNREISLLTNTLPSLIYYIPEK